jgi:two-component system sensor histidine kinase DesK
MNNMWSGIDRCEPKWLPFIWLAYLCFFFVHPVFDHVGPAEWALDIAGVAVFLALYFAFFLVPSPRNRWCIVGMLLLGIAFAPWNGGAVGFFIYAASLTPFAVESEKAAVAGLFGIVCLVALEWRLAHLENSFLAVGVFFCAIVGGGNIYFAQRNRNLRKLRLAHDEIEHLAKVAERERIARDLHDVLGHTLSLIALKSELAGKLVDRDPEQARREIHDVENAARDALSEVRQAILGYRSKGLNEEFKQARTTLETAGVAVDLQSAPIKLPAAQEGVLSLALKEAVTNVVRHAQAQHCWVRFERVNGHCVLQVRDDGRGGSQVEGNGLRGMRERIEALGGELHRSTVNGTSLEIKLPVGARGN